MQENTELSLLQVTLIDPQQSRHSLSVSSSECPIEFKSSLLTFAPTCAYTQFHLESGGKVLQDFQEFGEQISSGSALQMVPDAYDLKGFKFHYKRLLYLLAHPPSSRLSSEDPPEPALEGWEAPDIDLPAFEGCAVNIEGLLEPSSKLAPLQPSSEVYLSIPKCIISLTLSEQAPEEHRKICGDLGYIEVVTLEGQKFNITASVVGFFVNRTNETFSPEVADKSLTAVTLIGLLKKLSPLFDMSFSQLLAQAPLFDALESCKAPRDTPAWIFDTQAIREEAPGESHKNWNDEIQIARSLPSETPIQRIQKDKTVARIYSEFVEAAIAGAKAVVMGAVPPLNPMDSKKQHLFVFNYMFFSFTSDIEYEHEQGPEGCSSNVSVNHDLRSLKFLWNLEVEGLSSIACAVVDYRGHRVLCQSIIPGILSQTPENTAKYGSIDDGLTINTDPEFHALMQKVCQKLAISDSHLLDRNDERHHLWGAVDSKGIRGSDNRMYCLEAARLTPRDANFIGDKYVFCLVRPELVDAYLQVSQNTELEKASAQLLSQKKETNPDESKLTTEELQGLIANLPRISFNVNAFTNARFAEGQPEAETRVAELSKFLIEERIPALAKSLTSEDGNWTRLASSLADYFHKFGVNLRYIGLVCSHLAEVKYLRYNLERYALARCAKHILNSYIRDCSDYYLAEATAHLLNCLLDVDYSSTQTKGKRKRNRKKNQGFDFVEVGRPLCLQVTGKQLWEQLTAYAKGHFALEIQLPWNAIDTEDLKVVFLKEVALQLGLQMQSSFNVKSIKSTDIAAFAVKAKTLEWRSMESKWLQDLAVKSMNDNNLDSAIEMFTQSANVQAQITGPLQVDVAVCYQRMSQAYLAKGRFAQALNYQHKSILILEKVLGLDHLLVGYAYNTFGYQYQALGKFRRGMKHLLRALHIFIVNNGLTSPEVVSVLISICVAYRDLGQHSVATQILLDVFEMCKSLYGERHLNVAECAQLVSSEFKATSEYQEAKNWEFLALSIYKELLPEDDSRVTNSQKNIETIECLISGKLPSPGVSKGKKESRSYLKQKLYARKMKAKLNLPAHQLYMANQYFDIPASSTTQQAIEQERVQALAEHLNQS